VKMRTVAAVDATRARTLGRQVAVADRWTSRLRGLLFRPRLRAGEGLLLAPCRAIHTIGMRYPIDVVYLAATGEIVRLWHEVPPGKRLPWCRAAASVLELPPGTLAEAEAGVGDLVRID